MKKNQSYKAELRAESLKAELVHHDRYATRTQAAAVIPEWIEIF